MSEFKHKLILYTAILSLLIIVFVQRSCSAQTPQTTKQKVIVPEKKGEFTTPVAIFHKKEKKDSIVYKTIVVKTENPVNKELVEKLKEALKKKDTKIKKKKKKKFCKGKKKKTEFAVYVGGGLKQT